MARLRYNGLTATLGAALTSGGTTITFAAALTSAAGAVPTITGSDTIALSILDSAGNVSEVVSLTAYTSGATTGTIARAQEGTTAVAHAAGDKAVHGPTIRDFGSIKAFAKTVITSGDITLNATAVTAIGATASATDLTLPATVGDIVEYGLSGRLSPDAQYVGFDVYTRVSGANVNPFGAGLTASLATQAGHMAWFASNTAAYQMLSGTAARILTADDLSAGTVTLRLHYAKVNTTVRTLSANGNYQFAVWAKNLGQP